MAQAAFPPPPLPGSGVTATGRPRGPLQRRGMVVVRMTLRKGSLGPFEAAMAGAPIIAAIGAPSSAAIDLATATGTTLVGFLKSDKMNVYTYPERLQQ